VLGYQRPSAEVAFCHEERGRGEWPVSVSLVAARTILLERVGRIGCRGWQGRL